MNQFKAQQTQGKSPTHSRPVSEEEDESGTSSSSSESNYGNPDVIKYRTLEHATTPEPSDLQRKLSLQKKMAQQHQQFGSELVQSSNRGAVQRFTLRLRNALHVQSPDPMGRAMTLNFRGERISDGVDSNSIRRQDVNDWSMGEEYIMGEKEFAQSYASISHFKSQSSQTWGTTIHHKSMRRQSLIKDKIRRQRKEKTRWQRLLAWVKHEKLLEWSEMSIKVHISVYLIFIFAIFMFMQIFYLYKAQYQFMSTMENRLGMRISTAVSDQYKVVADNTIVQINIFFSVFMQLISRQSIVLSQVLADDVLFDGSGGPHPIMTSDSANIPSEEYKEMLLHPTRAKLSYLEGKQVRSLYSMKDFIQDSLDFDRNQRDIPAFLQEQFSNLHVENMYVYLVDEIEKETLLAFTNEHQEVSFHADAEVNRTILRDLYEEIRDQQQTIVSIGPFDLHEGYNDSITFAQPIFKDPVSKDGLFGIVVWEMDFKRTFDVIVIPKSFKEQMFAHIEVRNPYKNHLSDPILMNFWRDDFRDNQTYKMGDVLFQMNNTNRDEMLETIMEHKQFKDLLLSVQTNITKTNASSWSTEDIVLEECNYKLTELKQDTLILSQIANFIFINLLNDMFDVDFMEPIKDIQWKEREAAFCDKNQFTIFTQSIRGDHHPERMQAMLDKQLELEATLNAQMTDEEKHCHGDECDEDEWEDRDDWEDDEKKKKEEDDMDKRKLDEAFLKEPSAEVQDAKEVPEAENEQGEFKTRNDLNLVLSLIGEKIQKESPYQVMLSRYLDENMQFFFNFMVGLIILTSGILSVFIIQLIQKNVIHPLDELRMFINNNRENSNNAMTKFLQRVGDKEKTKKLKKQMKEEQHKRRLLNKASQGAFRKSTMFLNDTIIGNIVEPKTDKEGTVNIDEVEELRLDFARFFLQSSKFSNDQRSILDPTASLTQAKKQLRVGYMNETFSKNIISPKFLSNFLDVSNIPMKLFTNEKIQEGMLKLVKEIKIAKIKKALFRDFNQRFTISQYQGSDLGTPRSISIKNPHSAYTGNIQHTNREQFDGLELNKTIKFKKGGFKDLIQSQSQQDEEEQPILRMKSTDAVQIQDTRLEISKLADRHHQEQVENSPENLDNIILEFPFQQPQQSSGNFQMIPHRERAFQGDSFSVKRKDPPPAAPPQDKYEEHLNLNASKGFLFGQKNTGEDSLQPSPVRTEPAIQVNTTHILTKYSLKQFSQEVPFSAKAQYNQEDPQEKPAGDPESHSMMDMQGDHVYKKQSTTYIPNKADPSESD